MGLPFLHYGYSANLFVGTEGIRQTIRKQTGFYVCMCTILSYYLYSMHVYVYIRDGHKYSNTQFGYQYSFNVQSNYIFHAL